MKTWCIPPTANADFVYHMEDVLQVYQLPYDRRYPVVCMDEASKQLIGEANAPLPLRSGRVKYEDYEYERKGVCNQFMCCEPLRGWRHVRVASIMGSATLCFSRWTERRGCPLHRFQNRHKHRARLLTEKPLRRRRPVRPGEEKVVNGGEALPLAGQIESSQWMAAQG